MPTSDVCGSGSTWNAATGECEANCADGTVLVGNECVPDGTVICETGTTYNATTGKCDPDITGCAEGTVLLDGECVPYDDTLVGDITEPDEPNGFDGEPGEFDLPETGEAITISGCITPYEDADESGNLDPDDDLYLFSVTEQTLIEITVDGIGGLAGGFAVYGLDDQLLDGNWLRLGINLVNDTSKRQVFLPKAGSYLLNIGDSRAFMFGEGAGDDETCYFATVRTLAIPTPTAFDSAAELQCEDGVTNCTTIADCVGIGGGLCIPTVSGTMANDVQFFSYDPAEGEIAWTTMMAPSEALAPATVNELNTALHSFADGDLGVAAEGFLPGLYATDDVVFAVDHVYNIALGDTDYYFSVNAPTPIEFPADGNAAVPLIPNYYSWLYFDGDAGDVVHLTFNSAANLECDLIDSVSLTFLSDYMTPEFDAWIQLGSTGIHYIRCYNHDEVDFEMVATRTHVVPTPLTIGTLVDDATLSNDNVNWFELDVSPADWLVYTSDPANFDGDMMVDLYSRTNYGQLGYYVPIVDDFAFASVDDENARISVGDDSVFLIGIRDGGATPATASTFDFLVDERDFTDLGVVEEGTDIALTAVAVAADETLYYLARSDVFNEVDFAVTGGTGFDTVLTHIDATEAAITVINDTGAAEAEAFTTLIPAGGWVAFTINELAGTAGDFDLDAVATEAPSEAEPNDNPTQGLANNLVTPDGYYGTWGTVGDVDYYAITVAEGAWLAVETFDQNGPTTCSGIDTQVTIYGTDGVTELAYNDDGGVFYCSRLSWETDPDLQGMAAGTYYIKVNDFGNDSTGTYFLDIQVQVPVCGNGDIEWGETCDDNVIPPESGDGCDEFCQIETFTYSATPALAIPDSNPTGVTSVVTATATCNITFITVDLDISHTWKGDLIVELTSPTGTTVRLHDQSGGSADNIVGTYPTTLTPAESLDAFLGESTVGDWTLFASDSWTGDTGTINSWGVNLACL